MMTFYPQKSRRPKSKAFLTTIIVTVLIIGTLFCLQIFAGGIVGKVALTVGRPFSSVFTSFKNNFSFSTGFFSSKSALLKENQNLRSYIESNEAKNLRFETINREYQNLLSAYGRNASSSNFVLGNVIAKPPQSPYDVLIIDVGNDHGVGVGESVYGPGEILVGRVNEVTDSSSKVVLFSSVGEKSDVTVERTSESISIIGTGGGNLEAEAAQEMDIIIGDTVVLPQFNGAIIASVVSIDTSVTSAFKRVLLKSPLNIFSFRWVKVAR